MVIESTTTDSPAPTANSPFTSGDLGQHAFLKLLVAQLENQDPLNPMEDRDFIAQLAQFASLEKLTEMADSLSVLESEVPLPEGEEV